MDKTEQELQFIRTKSEAVEKYNQTEAQFVVRGIQILNGGGSIALLAFLGQIWTSAPELRSVILISIAIMTSGLIFTSWSSILRLRALDIAGKNLLRDKDQKIRLTGWRKIYHHHVYINMRSFSFLLFISSVIYLITGLSNKF